MIDKERPILASIPHTLSIIIPALNEEKNLSSTINMLAEASKAWKSVEYIVINDGSTDKTSEVAASFIPSINLKLINHNSPLGRGYSINEGYTEASGEYLIVFNGKKDTTEDQVQNIYNQFGHAEVIISYQSNTRERPLVRQIFSRLFTGTLNFLFKKKIKYYNGSILLKKSDFKRVRVTTDSYAYDAELLLKLLSLNLSYKEIPIIDTFESERRTRSLTIRNLIGVISTVFRLFFELRIKVVRRTVEL